MNEEEIYIFVYKLKVPRISSCRATVLFECRIFGVAGGNPDLYTDNPYGPGSIDAERMHRYSAAAESTNSPTVNLLKTLALFNLLDLPVYVKSHWII